MDRKETGRAIAGTIGMLAVELGAAKLTDTYGWSLIFGIALIGLLPLFWGWWPEITAAWPRHRWTFMRSVFLLVLVVGFGSQYLVRLRGPDAPKSAPLTQSDLRAAMRLPPRVNIKDVTGVWLTKDDGIRFNVHFSNDGQRAVRGISPHFGLGGAIGGFIPSKKMDEIFASLEKTPPPRGSSDLMQPEEIRLTTLPGDMTQHTQITQEELAKIQKEQQLMYLFIALNYFDDRTNDVWHTELCQFWDYRVAPELVPRIAPHYCASHNGVFPSKGKNNFSTPD